MVNKIKELTNELLQYCHEYYVLDNPSISDAEYDKKFDALKQMEDKANFWLANSPTRKVQGQVLDCFQKVQHSKPMLSAAKTKDINEIKKFIGGNRFYASYKLDGLTLVCIYENGKFKQAITRGTGLVGEDVTEQAKMISNLPMQIPYDGYLELRGECVVSWENFNKINASLTEPYSHPRNLAAGSLRNLDTNITKQRNLSYVVFECVSDLCDNKWNELYRLKDLGFTVVPIGVDLSVEDLIETMTPEACPYPIDGLVFEMTSKEYSKSLGATSHHENCRIAFKFVDELYETKLINIEFSIGKTGILTPIAIFSPIEINRTVVEKANLANLSVMQKTLGKPYVGQKVYVSKRNAVIPKIEYGEMIYE